MSDPPLLSYKPIVRLILKHGGICQYCGARVTRPRSDSYRLRNTDGTIDHLFPRCLGGSNDPSNLTLACYSCNEEKRCMTPTVFLVMRWIAWKNFHFDFIPEENNLANRSLSNNND